MKRLSMKWKSVPVALLLLIFTFLMTPAEGSSAEKGAAYPSGDIIFVNPNAAGGGNDLIMRALIPGMEKSLGVNLIPENKPAGRGAIAADEITTSKTPGSKVYINSQTLLLMPYGGIKIAVEKFQPVAQVVEDTGVFLVNGSAPYKTVNEFVTAAKTKKFKIAHNGVGALWHLAAVMFAKAAGIDFQYIAYPGGGRPMLTALAAGEVDAAIVNPAESRALLQGGKIRALAVMSDSKIPSLPDVPTCLEAGIKLIYPVWRGVFTTKGASEAILSTLDKAVKQGMAGEQFQTLIKTTGLVARFRDHVEFAKFFEEQKQVTADVMKDINSSKK
jgi:tripartite-type tricarboxylate transporter receptor subunit TctC